MAMCSRWTWAAAAIAAAWLGWSAGAAGAETGRTDTSVAQPPQEGHEHPPEPAEEPAEAPAEEPAEKPASERPDETTEPPPAAAGEPPKDHAIGGAMPGMAPGPLGVPASRAGSGTSWLPDASPMHALHAMRGEWRLMFHGNAFLHYVDEGDDRGDEDVGSVNWVMGMASREFAGGDLSLRSMLSLEPATLGECGYPVLLASGETCDGGRPLHDRQHPHDFFMELAALYERELGAGLAGQAYAALAGEPALGPTAFPHRVSALANPFAPITHHWLDSSHIAFGVVTGGLFGRSWKAEGSLFNGREPDEERWDLDLAALDSLAGRLWWLPGPRWALQVSAGHLEEAELEPESGARVDVDRATASATYHRPLAEGRLAAVTAAWGRNEEEGEATQALLLEGVVDLTAADTLFGRAEWAEKSGHDLVLADHALEERVFDVSRLAVGWARRVARVAELDLGLGAQVSSSFVPDRLEPFYGEARPFGWAIFATLRPATTAGAGGEDPHAGH